MALRYSASCIAAAVSPLYRSPRRVPIVTRCMAASTNHVLPRNFLLLQYAYVPDILEKRGPYRDEHLGAAQRQVDAGKIVMAGAFGKPVEGGLFIWKDSTEEEISTFAKSDTYVRNGLVTSWTIKPYTVVVGGL